MPSRQLSIVPRLECIFYLFPSRREYLHLASRCRMLSGEHLTRASCDCFWLHFDSHSRRRLPEPVHKSPDEGGQQPSTEADFDRPPEPREEETNSERSRRCHDNMKWQSCRCSGGLDNFRPHGSGSRNMQKRIWPDGREQARCEGGDSMKTKKSETAAWRWGTCEGERDWEAGQHWSNRREEESDYLPPTLCYALTHLLDDTFLAPTRAWAYRTLSRTPNFAILSASSSSSSSSLKLCSQHTRTHTSTHPLVHDWPPSPVGDTSVVICAQTLLIVVMTTTGLSEADLLRAVNWLLASPLYCTANTITDEMYEDCQQARLRAPSSPTTLQWTDAMRRLGECIKASQTSQSRWQIVNMTQEAYDEGYQNRGPKTEEIFGNEEDAGKRTYSCRSSLQLHQLLINFVMDTMGWRSHSVEEYESAKKHLNSVSNKRSFRDNFSELGKLFIL
ncbi:unnamed protein product [Protopolystoma xenopodis]|uniref:Uncharacterized protein n=1 Tax=Protopolystoma xenopodis TaxID=117903 RepID=A0A448XL28_9PLAT|nr:unnamed protein product [Protopolystoma xenopodis]